MSARTQKDQYCSATSKVAKIVGVFRFLKLRVYFPSIIKKLLAGNVDISISRQFFSPELSEMFPSLKSAKNPFPA